MVFYGLIDLSTRLTDWGYSMGSWLVFYMFVFNIIMVGSPWLRVFDVFEILRLGLLMAAQD